MPKMKTHSGVKDRFKITGGGRVMRRRQNRGHNLTKKRPCRKARLAKETRLSREDSKGVEKALGISVRNDPE